MSYTVVRFEAALETAVSSMLALEVARGDQESAFRYIFFLLEYGNFGSSPEIVAWCQKIKRHLEASFPAAYEKLTSDAHTSFNREMSRLKSSMTPDVS